MDVVHSPWMDEFLRHIATAKHEVVLVSPFIKLSLVRPLVLALPKAPVRLKVVTRFSSHTFRQSASDVSALDLLRLRPDAQVGDTELFALNRLHAKVYIFDRETVFIGSSNLSITGLDRNVEVCVKRRDAVLAQQLLMELEARSLFASRITAEDIAEMRRALQDAPAPLTQGAEDPADLAPDLEDILTGALEGDIGQPPAAAADKERVEQVERILRRLWSEERATLNGRRFESLSFRPTAADEVARKQQRDEWNEMAHRDLARIDAEVLAVLGIGRSSETQSFARAAFVDSAWVNAFRSLQPVGLGDCPYAAVGHALLNLAAAYGCFQHIAAGIVDVPQAQLAVERFLLDLDYDTILSSRGMRVLLHHGDLAEDTSRRQVECILGLVLAERGDVALRGLMAEIAGEAIRGVRVHEAKKDPKSVLLEVAQSMDLPLSYTAARSGGPAHEPTFSAFVTVGRRKIGPVEGSSKKRAELAVAQAAISTAEHGTEVRRRDPATGGRSALSSSACDVPHQR